MSKMYCIGRSSLESASRSDAYDRASYPVSTYAIRSHLRAAFSIGLQRERELGYRAICVESFDF